MKNNNDLGFISYQLREWVHTASDSLFVAKGFAEDLESEIRNQNYLRDDFDHQDFKAMALAVLRNLEKIDASLNNLRQFAKQEMFMDGLPKASLKPEDAKWK